MKRALGLALWIGMPVLSMWIATSVAAAQEAAVHGYALVVGSNPGGPGQRRLRFAEEDARRMAGVLTELSQYRSERVTRLLGPEPDELWSALDALRRRLEDHAERGEQSQLFFYYSGHARAGGINLADRVVALDELREHLEALPTTLTLVVLDACQSGAFSRSKGAEPAADFSFNSVQRLDTRGMAVMASSTANELSQESERLRSSFFTHHLVSAMRGAGDLDEDGRVSLDEAYRYAYNRTLAATAATAVGAQHVTLETDLRGQGEVPIAFPAEATAHLELPRGFEGEALVQRRPQLSVMAEVYQSRNDPLRIALPAGRYLVTLRSGSRRARCDVAVAEGATTPVDHSQCEPVEELDASRKGGDSHSEAREPGHPGWGIQAYAGWGAARRDAFSDRLRQFELEPHDASGFRWGMSVHRNLLPFLTVGLTFFKLESNVYRRRTPDYNQDFRWSSFAFGAWGRLEWPVRFGEAAWFVPYLQLGVGPAFTMSTFDELVVQPEQFPDDPSVDVTPSQRAHEETDWGYHVSALVGFQIKVSRHFGIFMQGGYVFAPALHNEVDESHDAGGYLAVFGVELTTWEEAR